VPLSAYGCLWLPPSASECLGCLHARAVDERHGEAGKTAPQLGFSYTLAEATDSAVPTALLTYCVELPGRHELYITLLGKRLGDAPYALQVLVPAWGPGLQMGVAGQHAILYVRLRPEGLLEPGSSEGRKLLHRLKVEATETLSLECARCIVRQVSPSDDLR